MGSLRGQQRISEGVTRGARNTGRSLRGMTGRPGDGRWGVTKVAVGLKGTLGGLWGGDGGGSDAGLGDRKAHV